MMLLLLALLAPAELAGAPGAQVAFSVEIVGTDEAQISASKPLLLDTRSNGSVVARIDTEARPGVYDGYLYAAPISDEKIVVAAAAPVRVRVRNTSHAGLLASTTHTFKAHRWWATPALLLVGVALLWALGAFEVRLA